MKAAMRPAYTVELVTPRKVQLNGLWLGPAKAKRVVIWVHGLGSSMFSKLGIADALVDKDTAVLAFNNRGHGKVMYASRGAKSLRVGSAHEIFTDCADDIEGAIRFAKAAGAREIFLAGHSTGCQKSVYWAAKGRGVKGIILLAPISDYAAELTMSTRAAITKGLAHARALVKSGRGNQLMPESLRPWPLLTDAQRYVSLFSGDSLEEIFTYWAPERTPVALRKVRVPILVLLAEKDEYRDRPPRKMADWFTEHLNRTNRVAVVPKVGHSFKGAERVVAQHMHSFMKAIKQ